MSRKPRHGGVTTYAPRCGESRWRRVDHAAVGSLPDRWPILLSVMSETFQGNANPMCQ
jgi:hypothetical protein